MYCQHFNLEKKPFQISSDNQFLWLGEKHASALELLKQGIAQNQGLLVLTGDVGTGKTTLINEIIHTLDAETRTVVIADSCFEMHHLFLTIAQAFGFEDQYQTDKKFSAEFVSFLKTEKTKGRKALVIIDEAQRIPERFLKEIISWSGFGLSQVLTVILAGQLEFQYVLEKNLGQGWRDHIKTHAFLEPLDENETKIYINKRLEFSGSRRKIFLISAIHEVHVYSKGFPRTINIVCDQALIAAFAKGMRLVDVPTFKEAMGQLDLPIIPPGEKNVHPEETISSQGPWFQRKSMIGGAVFVLICLFAGYLYYGKNGPFFLQKESLAPPDLISQENQLQNPKLPAASDPLNRLEQIPPPKTIEPAALKVQEPEDPNEGQNIEIAYTPAPSMQDKEGPSPVLINNPGQTDLISQENQLQNPKLPAASDPLNRLEQIPPPKTIEPAAPQVLEPEDPNEGQNIEIAYVPAASMEDKENPSPVLIDNFMETDQAIERERAEPKDIDGFVNDVFSFKEKTNSVDSEDTVTLEPSKKTAPESAEPFEETPVAGDSVLNEPEPGAIIDWLINKKGANKTETQ